MLVFRRSKSAFVSPVKLSPGTPVRSTETRSFRPVVAMSGNKVLADLIGSVDRRVRWYYLPIALARGKDAWDEHAELIEAIGRRSAKRAGDLMRRHTERTREIYHERRHETAEGVA